MNKKRWSNFIYAIVCLASLGLAVYQIHDKTLFNENTHKEVYIEEDEVRNLANLINYGEEFEDTILWRYNEDTTSTEYIFSSDNIKHIPFTTTDITDKIAYQKMLLYHNNKLCFLNRVNSLPEESELRRLLHRTYVNPITDNVFLTSCPIYIEDDLWGYVSSVFDNEGNAVVIHLSNVELLSKSISKYMENRVLSK